MTRLGDRYELHHVVGRGGMGEVWAARDLRQGREVAVKTVPGTEQPETADRLRHEAVVTAAIDHAGVVDVYDSGADGATAYLVMDLLPGPDLDVMLREGPVPAAEAVRIVAAVADTLVAAHRAGVVHGDVKPANVVVSGGDVALIDFGAALPTGDDGGPVTFGTAPYMAPEQVRTRSIVPATDVYALGCLLHATLTGRPPFHDDSPMAVLHRHVRDRPPRLGELASGVPRELDDLLARMLAKDPGRRVTAAQVRDGLVAAARAHALADLKPRSVPQDSDGLDPQATLPTLVMLPGTGAPLPRAA